MSAKAQAMEEPSNRATHLRNNIIISQYGITGFIIKNRYGHIWIIVSPQVVVYDKEKNRIGIWGGVKEEMPTPVTTYLIDLVYFAYFTPPPKWYY